MCDIDLYNLSNTGLIDWLPDKYYAVLQWRFKMGRRLNLKTPKTFNEKLQWLKIYDGNMDYVTMVDKATAKNYISGIIGCEHIIPTLGIWNSFDEIDLGLLPNQFVLKCKFETL